MKLLLQHLRHNREALLQLSKAVGMADHAVNLGVARESLVKNFIETNLPEYIRYHSGEVFDRYGKRSGQIDLVLHPVTAPKIYLQNTISIFPAETVLAAIEVKSKLTTGNSTGSLHEALETCKKLKGVKRLSKQLVSSNPLDPERVPFILFAFNGPQVETLRKQLATYFGSDEINARLMPDLIVVLDRGYYLKKVGNWHRAGMTEEELYRQTLEPDAVLLGLFQLILKLVENWVENPSAHTMPIEAYTQDMPASLFRSE